MMQETSQSQSRWQSVRLFLATCATVSSCMWLPWVSLMATSWGTTLPAALGLGHGVHGDGSASYELAWKGDVFARAAADEHADAIAKLSWSTGGAGFFAPTRSRTTYSLSVLPVSGEPPWKGVAPLALRAAAELAGADRGLPQEVLAELMTSAKAATYRPRPAGYVLNAITIMALMWLTGVGWHSGRRMISRRREGRGTARVATGIGLSAGH